MQAFILKLKLTWKIPRLVNPKLSLSNPNENAVCLLTHSCFSPWCRLLILPVAQLILLYMKFSAAVMVWLQLLRLFTCLCPTCLNLYPSMSPKRDGGKKIPGSSQLFFSVLLIVWLQVASSDAESCSYSPVLRQAASAAAWWSKHEEEFLGQVPSDRRWRVK